MLYSVKGELIHMEPQVAVICCGGVGFKCRITMNTARQLPALGGEAMLYTIMNVREDAIELFGFAEQGELNCFKQLTAITGVGLWKPWCARRSRDWDGKSRMPKQMTRGERHGNGL